MYEILKNMVAKVIPRKTLLQLGPFIRKPLFFFYKGKTFTCPICLASLRKFIALSNGEELCPRCGSLGRHRLLYLLLKDELFNKKVLDFSPPSSIYRKFKSNSDITYISSDFSNEFLADKTLDITNIAEPSESFDLIICFHVLEHIENDVAAMKELYRVLKKGGSCWIQTPYKVGAILEDKNVTSPQERLRLFGQEDHVRIYSMEGLKSRLEDQGFSIEVKEPVISAASYGISKNEVILIAKK